MMHNLTLSIISTTVELNSVVCLLTADEKETNRSIIGRAYAWLQDCDTLGGKITASLILSRVLIRYS
jgi:hypothetical protein